MRISFLDSDLDRLFGTDGFNDLCFVSCNTTASEHRSGHASDGFVSYNRDYINLILFVNVNI
jgi:hypothetical protein